MWFFHFNLINKSKLIRNLETLISLRNILILTILENIMFHLSIKKKHQFHFPLKQNHTRSSIWKQWLTSFNNRGISTYPLKQELEKHYLYFVAF